MRIALAPRSCGSRPGGDFRGFLSPLQGELPFRKKHMSNRLAGFECLRDPRQACSPIAGRPGRGGCVTDPLINDCDLVAQGRTGDKQRLPIAGSAVGRRSRANFGISLRPQLRG